MRFRASTRCLETVSFVSKVGDAFRKTHPFGEAERSVMTAKEREKMSEEAQTKLKTTDVDAAKRFIVKNDPKGRYRLQCSFGTFHPTIYTTLPFPNRKALFNALDEIDSRNRPDSYEYSHLPVEERITVCDFIHDSNIRETICTFKVDTDYCGGVYVGIKVKANPVWSAMTSQWYSERQAKAEAEAAADEEEE